MIRTRWSAWALVGVLTMSSLAQSQGDAMTEMARERFQEGVTYYDAKQFDKARAAFLQAYALKKHPAVLLNLAQSELRSSHEAAAAKHFAQYLRENKAATEVERQEAEKGLAAARAKVGEISVEGLEAGAEVFVDGEPEGTTPLPQPIFLAPGPHTVEARRAGKVAKESVTAAAGVKATVTLSFAAKTAPPPAAAPPKPATPPPAPESPEPTEPGDPAPVEPPVEASDPAPTGGREPFVPWALKTPVAWAGAGLTALGVIGGVTFAAMAGSKYSDSDSIAEEIRARAAADGVSGPCPDLVVPGKTDYRPACAKYRDTVDSAESLETFSIVSFVVGGLAAGGTVLFYFVTAEKEPPPPSAAVVPFLVPGGQGLGVVGTF
ncbi:MAG: tetratricopeptide repeat protein [Polyangiaceae bacterium]|nr:tetratricopeptide repeat protein [Polyangiaceae bacterium]